MERLRESAGITRDEGGGERRIKRKEG